MTKRKTSAIDKEIERLQSAIADLEEEKSRIELEGQLSTIDLEDVKWFFAFDLEEYLESDYGRYDSLRPIVGILAEEGLKARTRQK